MARTTTKQPTRKTTATLTKKQQVKDNLGDIFVHSTSAIASTFETVDVIVQAIAKEVREF